MEIKCNFKDICDCKTMPIGLCPLKQVLEYCLTSENKALDKIKIVKMLTV